VSDTKAEPQVVQTVRAEETEAVAERLAAALRPGDVIALSGDLGAGKTTFTRGLARGLGSRAPVSSPTFTLIHEYAGGRLPVYHVDAYRLRSAEDALSAGLADYLNRADGVIVIEWPENVVGLLPAERLDVMLMEEGDARRILFAPRGARWQDFTAC
jgi:tRNA threonylcarbamoyladenosine biosynthesis protein TsaE